MLSFPPFTSLCSAHFYHPKRSCGKGMFLHLSVSHSVDRGIWQTPQADTPSRRTLLGRHPTWQMPPWADTPWSRQPPGRHPLQPNTPLGRHPARQTLPRQTPPAQCMLGYMPPGGHCAGWYTSYWNAFLFFNISLFFKLIELMCTIFMKFLVFSLLVRNKRKIVGEYIFER